MEIDINLVLEICAAIVILANIIARRTPTNKDNTLIEKIRKGLEFIGTLGLPDKVKIPTKKKK